MLSVDSKPTQEVFFWNQNAILRAALTTEYRRFARTRGCFSNKGPDLLGFQASWPHVGKRVELFGVDECLDSFVDGGSGSAISCARAIC